MACALRIGSTSSRRIRAESIGPAMVRIRVEAAGAFDALARCGIRACGCAVVGGPRPAGVAASAQALDGCSAMIAMPVKATAAPVTSQRVSATLSTSASQASATAMYMPP